MPRHTALDVLVRVERSDARAREALDARLARHPLAARDHELARELVLGTLRRLETLDHLLGSRVRRPLAGATPRVRNALRLGAYQLVFLDRVPAHAAVDSSVELVKVRDPGAAGFVNAVLRRLAQAVTERRLEGPGDDPCRSLPLDAGAHVRLREAELPPPESGLAAHLAARWSHPEWLVERFLAQHGESGALALLASGVARPPVTLRPAPGRTAELRAALERASIAVEEEGPCLLVRGAGPVTALPGFDEDWFRVQGPTAAEAVPALAPGPGDAVLELCAAPGGKTLAIAEAVGPGGLVMAVDLPGARSERLRALVARRGLENVSVLAADATDPESLPTRARGREGFDCVLVDVPCSNTGVLGRRVEARRRLEGPERIHMLAEQAHHLLLVGASRVRPGGRIAYSTCSVDRAENEAVIEAFLDEDPEFDAVSERLVLPVAGRRDGGFVAVLRRESS